MLCASLRADSRLIPTPINAPISKGSALTGPGRGRLAAGREEEREGRSEQAFESARERRPLRGGRPATGSLESRAPQVRQLRQHAAQALSPGEPEPPATADMAWRRREERGPTATRGERESARAGDAEQGTSGEGVRCVGGHTKAARGRSEVCVRVCGDTHALNAEMKGGEEKRKRCFLSPLLGVPLYSSFPRLRARRRTQPPPGRHPTPTR